MKGGRHPHRVPLSSQAMQILAARRGNGSELIFPSTMGKVMDGNRLTEMVKELKLGFDVHGLRTAWRDWASLNRIDHDVAELVLAHRKSNKVEAAYNRTDLLELRRDAMQQYADYITESRK